MNVKIMMLGDAVGDCGVAYLAEGGRLRREARERGVSLVIVNGENSAAENGITADSARALADAGADVITGGNHTLRRRSVYSMLDDDCRMLRPANYPAADPGTGSRVFDVCGYRLLVINLAGQVFTDTRASSPFYALDAELSMWKGRFNAAVVDIHAEATSEKLALARYADGRVSAVAGTHTHVQTADATVLPGGCGYITDLGMCGSHAGVLGVSSEPVIHRYLSATPCRFTPAFGECSAHGAIFELDLPSGRCIGAEAISF